MIKSIFGRISDFLFGLLLNKFGQKIPTDSKRRFFITSLTAVVTNNDTDNTQLISAICSHFNLKLTLVQFQSMMKVSNRIWEQNKPLRVDRALLFSNVPSDASAEKERIAMAFTQRAPQILCYGSRELMVIDAIKTIELAQKAVQSS